MIIWLEDNRNGFAVINYTAYRDYADRVSVNSIDGMEPSPATIGNKRYPLVSSTYVCMKGQNNNPVPGLQQFLYELTSERALSPEGYVVERGLVPLDVIGRNRARNEALRFDMQ